MHRILNLVKRHLIGVAFFFAANAGAQTIALDVGHFLSEPGATSARGVPEFEFNRALAVSVERHLRNGGLTTIVIGADGLQRDLAERPRKALGADLFISIHHDSAKARFLKTWTVDGVDRAYLDDRFKGFSIFVSRENPKLAQSLACASALGAQLRVHGFAPSRYHADNELGESRVFADEANGVHYFDHLAVLRRATMPAILFEAGVILNRDEELAVSSEASREKIAQAVLHAAQICLR